MPQYIVNSAILNKDPKACAEGAAKMLASGKVKDVQARSCYCSSAEGRVAFVIEGASRDAVLQAMEKIDVPVASIMEAEEVKAKK
jgi:nitrate reductase NapAB chaperone NapD